MKTQTLIRHSVTYLTLVFLLTSGAATALAEGEPEARVSRSSQGQGTEPTVIAGDASSVDEYEALVVAGSRNRSTRASAQKETRTAGFEAGAKTPNLEFWIYDADVELFADWDRDGYYYGIDLTFDADTIYTAADVYAVIYLSYDFGPWNEFSSTDDFTIFGTSGSDEYSVETELVSGYITGDYDILIELFDVYDGSFVASFGPEDSQALSYLPLEDVGRDTPPQTTVIVSEGGGSLGLLGLMTLLCFVGRRRHRCVPR